MLCNEIKLTSCKKYCEFPLKNLNLWIISNIQYPIWTKWTLFNLKIELIILDCFVSYGLSLIFQAVVVQNELFIQCQAELSDVQRAKWYHPSGLIIFRFAWKKFEQLSRFDWTKVTFISTCTLLNDEAGYSENSSSNKLYNNQNRNLHRYAKCMQTKAKPLLLFLSHFLWQQ